jgi:hypothetical protein
VDLVAILSTVTVIRRCKTTKFRTPFVSVSISNPLESSIPCSTKSLTIGFHPEGSREVTKTRLEDTTLISRLPPSIWIEAVFVKRLLLLKMWFYCT